MITKFLKTNKEIKKKSQQHQDSSWSLVQKKKKKKIQVLTQKIIVELKQQ